MGLCPGRRSRSQRGAAVRATKTSDRAWRAVAAVALYASSTNNPSEFFLPPRPTVHPAMGRLLPRLPADLNRLPAL
eukprot:1215609-Rhodomonas_salina.2